MTPGVQALLVIIGALLSALLTALLTQVAGLRSDMRRFLETQQDHSDRLIKLETEHAVRACLKDAR